MTDKYILNKQGEPVPCEDVVTWGRAMAGKRRVAYWETSAKRWEDRISLRDEWRPRRRVPRVAVSTVFLGLDHRFFGEGPPILYETMIFGGPNDGEQRRYATRDEALAGHKRMVLIADKHSLDSHLLWLRQAAYSSAADLFATHRQRKAARRAAWLTEQAEYRASLN